MRLIAPGFASALCLSTLLVSPAAAAENRFPQPLAEESLPSVAKLPAVWPQSWVTVHDFHFNAIVDGRLAVVDTADQVQPLKGLVRAAQFANALIAKDRGELYTAETFYTRLTRGERTDVITVWDMATLQPKGEIVLLVAPPGEGVTVMSAEDLDARLRKALATLSVKDAASVVAAETGQPRRQVYARAVEIMAADRTE